MNTPQPQALIAPGDKALQRASALWPRFARHRGAVAGLAVLVLLALFAVFADVIAAHGPAEQARSAVLAPPWWSGGTSEFMFGTDELGRDILARVIYGARTSLLTEIGRAHV